MEIKNITDCPCGQKHPTVNIKVEIGRGLLPKTTEILKDFPKKILVVADKNTLAASEGILDVLKAGGFDYGLHCYDNCTEADIEMVKEMEKIAASYDGVLAVGTGSIGDICRLAAFNTKKEFAIFATAPSMDGFASFAAPITFNNLKETVPCAVPSIIIGDTDILAKSPNELKSAGFGDVIAKYVALVEWKIAALLIQEHFCPTVHGMVNDVLKKTMALADDVTREDPEAAGALMEALVLSGACMTIADSTRPASAAEHIISHYLEMRILQSGGPMPFHGTKVGVGTVLITHLYHDIADGKLGQPDFGEDRVDWDAVYKHFGPAMKGKIDEINSASSISEVSPEVLKKHWPEVCRLIKEELPSYEEIVDLMKRANAVIDISGLGLDRQLGLDALEFHPYVNKKLTITRMLPMLGLKPDWDVQIDKSLA